MNPLHTDHETNPDTIGDKISRISTDIKAVIGQGREAAGDSVMQAAKSALDGGKAAAKSVSSTIGQHPFSSALIAVGVGLLVGYLISRR